MHLQSAGSPDFKVPAVAEVSSSFLHLPTSVLHHICVITVTKATPTLSFCKAVSTKALNGCTQAPGSLVQDCHHLLHICLQQVLGLHLHKAWTSLKLIPKQAQGTSFQVNRAIVARVGFLKVARTRQDILTAPRSRGDL